MRTLTLGAARVVFYLRIAHALGFLEIKTDFSRGFQFKRG